MEGQQIETKNQSDLPISQVTTETNLSLEELIDAKIQSKISNPDQRKNIISSCQTLQDELKQPLDGFIKGLSTLTIAKLSKLFDPQEIKSFLLSKFDALKPNATLQIAQENIGAHTETKVENSEIKEENIALTNKNILLQNKNAEKEAAKEKFNAAMDNYKNLEDKYKANDQQLANYKASLPLGSITKIEEKLEGTGISTDDFLKISYSAKSHPDELKDTDFLKNYEQAKNLLEIPDAWLGKPETIETLTKGYEVRNMVQTNESLSTYANDTSHFPSFDTIDYKDISEHITSDDVDFINNFGNETIQKDLKNFQKTMQENKYDIYFDTYGNLLKDDLTLPDDAQKFSTDYHTFLQTSISGINAGLNTKKDQIIRNESLGSWISGVANLFDTTTFNKEHFSSDTTLQGVSFDDAGMLTISGSIKDTPIELSGDPTNEESLQINSYAIESGVFQKTEESLHIKTPTVSKLSEIAQSLLKEPGMTDSILKEAKSPKEFENLLQHMIMKELESSFTEAPLAKNRVEGHIENNLAMHEFMYEFLPDDTIDGDKVKKDDDKEAYNMVATGSLTLQSLTPPEIRQFRTLQKETKDILSKDELPDHVSGPLKNILSDAKADMDDGGLGGIRQFFALMSPDISDITDLKTDDAAAINLDDRSGLLTFMEKPHKEEELKKFVSSDFITKLDQMSAEELLKDIPGEKTDKKLANTPGERNLA